MDNRVPAYLYHAAHGAQVFHDGDALDAALADGWVDSPDKVAGLPPDTSADVPAETGIPVEISGMDVTALKAFAKERFPSMVIHPAIKLETLQGKVSVALEQQFQAQE